MPVGDRNGSRAQAVALGAVIRELRQSLGWSQSRLASALCKVADHTTVTRENISRGETGKRVPGRWWLRRLATVLQVSIEILERAGVDRRHSLTTVAGASIAPVAAADLIAHGFAAALHGSYPSVDDWGQAVVTYGRDYMTSGASEIQKRLAADLVVLQQQLDAPRLWAVWAKLATLYGKTFPGNDGVKALTWYRHAAKFADRSEDQETRIGVRGRAAIALGYEGACLDAADVLAEQAIAPDDRPSLGRLNAVMGKAHVAAIRGNSSAAMVLLEEGQSMRRRGARGCRIQLCGALVAVQRVHVVDGCAFGYGTPGSAGPG